MNTSREIFAMAGAAEGAQSDCYELRGLVTAAVARTRLSNLPGDMRVKVESLGIYMYPRYRGCLRYAAIRGWPTRHPAQSTLLLEVLSHSTASYDQGLKFRRYQLITFAEYLLIARDRPLVEHRLRLPDGTWETRITNDPTATLTLPSIGCTLPLTAIYEDITADPPPGPRPPTSARARAQTINHSDDTTPAFVLCFANTCRDVSFLSSREGCRPQAAG
ncbi:MAG: Uma2 family endonuclease [Thermomicrobiales bacterium]